MKARLLAVLLIFALVVTASLEIPLGLTLQAHARSTVRSELRRDEVALSVVVGMALEHNETHRAVGIVTRYARATGRVVVVKQGRTVIVTSGPSGDRQSAEGTLASAMRSVGRHALVGQTVARKGDPSHIYAAMALSGEPYRRGSAILLMTVPASAVSSEIYESWLLLGGIGAGVLLVAVILGLLLSRSLLRPLRRIESSVSAIGKGALAERAPTESGPRELRELARVINVTAARLVKLLETQRSFVADASHQLRTPLTALRLRLEKLNETSGSSDAAAAVAEVSRLTRMVSALLTMARYEAAGDGVVPIDVSGVVNERYQAWKPLADEQHVAFTRSCEVTGTCALSRPEAVEQILDNLLANAFEVTTAGGRVGVVVQRASGFVEIHVMDDGPGLSAEDRKRAFDRFWRGATSTHDGAGLGLAVVDQLARLAGGSAELLNASSCGLDAVVRLPAASGEDRLEPPQPVSLPSVSCPTLY